MNEESDMREVDKALERLLSENPSLALFASAVASACRRMELQPPLNRTARFVAEAIGEFLDSARAASHPLSSVRVSTETNAAVRLLATSLVAQRHRQKRSNETIQ